MNENFPAELEGLIRTIERDIYAHPDSVIAPLRQLLQQCHGNEQVGYTCGQLGFAFLLMGEHRMSRVFYEYALSVLPNEVYVLANLAHAVYELGEKEIGVEYGRRALHLKDVLVMAAGKAEMAARHGGRKNLISFTLYGDNARYCETAVLNCLAAKQHFPEFVCRFYIDSSVPGDVLNRLRENNAEVVPVAGRAASFFPTAWRFLAIDDKDSDIVLVRDVDSIVDVREAYCVKEWIDSGKPFHIIRDDCCHTELIQAGLFGVRSGIAGNIEDKIADFVASVENQPIGRYSDQLFLRKIIWPMIRDQAVTHDRVYGYGTDVRNVPVKVLGSSGICNDFMGANYANQRLQFSIQESIQGDAQYILRIIGETGRIVCEHRLDWAGGQRLQIFVPRSYAEKIAAGAWRYEINSKGGPALP